MKTVMQKQKLVTEWTHPEDTINSQWGNLVFNEWCLKEAARINAHGDSVSVIHSEDGLIAISR